MPYAQVRGVNLYYEDRGQGQPLLLIPGALGTGQSDFSPQLEQLPQQGLRVIVPDARGYGKSRPPVRQFPLDFYEQDAQDCVALMEAIGCQSYAVGGWSDGAIIAMLLTLQRPQQVSKMVIWGGNAYLAREDIEAYEATRQLSSWSQRMIDAMAAIYGEELQDLWSCWCDAMQALYRAGGELCQARQQSACIHIPKFHRAGSSEVEPFVGPPNRIATGQTPAIRRRLARSGRH